MVARVKAGARSKQKRRRKSSQSKKASRADHSQRIATIRGSRTTIYFAMALATLYTFWVIVVPPRWLESEFREVWLWPRRMIYRLLTTVCRELGLEQVSAHVLGACYLFIVALLIPLCVAKLFRMGKLSRLGWRRPNRLLLRIVSCSFCISIPFLFWMVSSPGFASFYAKYIDAGIFRLIGYYLVALFCEHSFFDGILLAAFRRGHQWPSAPSMDQSASSRTGKGLQWLGVAQPTHDAKGWQRATRWLGLPDGATTAILMSGFLFGMVHLGKDGREFLLSFPGGVFLACLAYRCNSWHAPYILHASTATAAGLMLWFTV